MGGGSVKIAIALVNFSLWAGSAIPLAAFAQDKPDQPPRATAEDCAVIAAVGEGQLHWREKSPDSAMYARSFGVDCDFKSMGIKDFDIPALGSGRYPVFSGLRFSFSRPHLFEGFHHSHHILFIFRKRWTTPVALFFGIPVYG